jgi:colicin import membrane protein
VKINWSEPGIPISAAIHVALLLATLIAFATTPKFEEQPESIAVEMVTSDQLTAMTKGDKTVKEIKPNAKPKADKVAQEELIKPDSADAKKDIPSPPAKPPEQPPVPEPKSAPTPPPTPTPVPPEPKPTQPEAKPDPAPVDPKPDGLKQAPPPKPEPKPLPPKAEPDPIEKKLEQDKKAQPPKPVEAPKTPTTAFDPAALQKLLVSKETPQKMASTASETSKTSTAGTATGTAAKLSLSQLDQINGYIYKKVTDCWKLANLFPDPNRPAPQIRIKLREDGALDGPPTVESPSSDTSGRALEESAIRAISGCAAPFDLLPKQFKPFYGEWRSVVLSFTLKDA